MSSVHEASCNTNIGMSLPVVEISANTQRCIEIKAQVHICLLRPKGLWHFRRSPATKHRI